MGGLLLAAVSCAPTDLPVALAETQCMQYALNGGGSVTVGMSIGTGNWNGGWGGNGAGVGITAATTLPPAQGTAQIYNSCVQRRSGQPPVTPFDQRPELRG